MQLHERTAADRDRVRRSRIGQGFPPTCQDPRLVEPFRAIVAWLEEQKPPAPKRRRRAA
jgi:hypothetical protein